MHRRRFLKQTGKSLSVTPFLFTIPSIYRNSFVQVEWQTFLNLLIYHNDVAVNNMLQRQTVEKYHSFYGGIPNVYDIYQPMGAAMFMQYAASAYSNEQSQYYGAESLPERMELAVQFLKNMQYEDGTIDLLSTNFHSTPDTGFVVEPLCLAYQILHQTQLPQVASCVAELKSFLLQAGKALSVGGIHTPNHRWVVSMALSRLHQLFPNKVYLDRISEWLEEGIDIDPDGQYTEKSTNIYSPLTNRCLITIARILGRPELLEPVRKNLRMTLYYIHPNGEIATEASGRQDQYQVGTLREYFYPYHYMAIKDQQGIFAAMSSLITQTLSPQHLIRNLAYIQEDSTLNEPLPPSKHIPNAYRRFFSHSNLVRIRRGKMDATILAQNPLFFTFSKGKAVLQGIRVAAAFFGKGQFVGEKIMEEQGTYIMTQKLTGPYYQPYPREDLPGDGDWDKMPRSQRPQSEVQTLNYRIEIKENTDGYILSFELTGTEKVPVAIELGLRKGCTLERITTHDRTEDAYILNEGKGRYSFQDDYIEFGNGKAEHSWIQLRGALPKLDAQCVYITGYTPFTYELILT